MSHFRPWPWPRLLAHRGAGTLAPENTIAALKVGLSHGYRAVEFDAMVPADDVAVLMHDATLARTARRPGKIADLRAQELARLDAGAWHSASYVGERIPLLKDVLQFCRDNAIWTNIEIKPVPGHEERTGRVVAREIAVAFEDVIRPNGDRSDNADARVPLVSSFSTSALEAARLEAPDVPRALLVEDVKPDWRAWLDQFGCVSLHADHARLNRPQAERIKAEGFWLFCYTVNQRARAVELLSWGVDAMCTDRIDLIPPDLA